MTRTRFVTAVAGTLALFLGVQGVAVVLAPTLASEGVQYGDGGAALVPLVAGLVVGTLIAVAVARYGVSPRLFRAMVLVGFAVSIVLAVGPLAVRSLAGVGGTVAGVENAVWLGGAVGLLAAVVATWVVVRTERAAVRNVLAAIGTAGVAAVFGASLSPAFAAVGLGLAAVYDAIAVYGTGHMQQLAGLGSRLDLPTVFVVGRDAEGDRAAADEVSRTVEENEASRTAGAGGPSAPVETAGRPAETNGSSGFGGLLFGTGDALFPAMLAASVRTHTATIQVVGGPSPLVAVVGPVVGSVVGFLVLQAIVARGGTHAGLPFVAGGAVLGWLVTGL